MLKVQDIRALSADEMEQKIAALKKELFDLRFQLKTGKLEKHGRFLETRKAIARVMTLLNEEKRKTRTETTSARKVSK